MTGRPEPGGASGEPAVPAYDAGWLGAVLPGTARALGVHVPGPAIDLPASRAVCVVLVDGLGLEQLQAVGRAAPFLTRLLPGGGELRVGCPTTTAASLGSFGTALPPGRHGLVGYEVLDPDRGVLLNQLAWDPAVDPVAWQPHRTMLEAMTARGVTVTATGNPEFAGSGLTVAALRGGDFVGLKRLRDRVDLALHRLCAPGPALVYLYWGAVDGAGHLHGVRSPRWRSAVRGTDRELTRLARRLPRGCTLVICADHGMLDVPHANRLDLADRPDLAAGIDILGGEPRFAQIYCQPERAEAISNRLADALGDRAWVRRRDEAVAAGWFGPVEPRVLPRIGRVLVAARGSFAMVDSRTTRPQVLRLIGQHGSLTDAEQRVPLLRVTG